MADSAGWGGPESSGPGRLGSVKSGRYPAPSLEMTVPPHVAAHQRSPRLPAQPDLRLALAAAAAVPGPDRGAVRLRVPVPEGAEAPGAGREQPDRAGHHAA